MKVLPTSLLGALPVAAASIAILAASPSQAAILNATGVYDPLANTYFVRGSDQVDIYPNSYFQNSGLNLSTRQNSLISDRIRGFNEKQSVKFNTDIWANIDVHNFTNNPQDWNQALTNIPSNTSISSHYFWLMPPLVSPPVFRTYVTVKIEFSEEIIGVIGNGPQLVQTNSLLGLSNVIYSSSGETQLDTVYWQGQIVSDNDMVRSINGRFLTIYVNSASGLDTFRVITKADAVPEPLTILGAGTAAGFGVFFKRELAKRKKKAE